MTAPESCSCYWLRNLICQVSSHGYGDLECYVYLLGEKGWQNMVYDMNVHQIVIIIPVYSTLFTSFCGTSKAKCNTGITLPLVCLSFAGATYIPEFHFTLHKWFVSWNMIGNSRFCILLYWTTVLLIFDHCKRHFALSSSRIYVSCYPSDLQQIIDNFEYIIQKGLQICSIFDPSVLGLQMK